jgi:hypothetical protein
VNVFKKIIFSVFLLIGITAGTLAYLHLKNSKKPTVSALTFLPDNCLLYLNTTNFFELNKKINSQSLIVDKLKGFGDINQFCNTLNSFDSIFSTNNNLKEIISNNPIHFALYDDNFSWIAAFNIKTSGNNNLIKEEFENTFKTKIHSNVYQFSFSKKNNYYLTLKSGIVLISNSNNMIDIALDEKTIKIEKNKAFLNFQSNLKENNLVSVFVNHANYLNSNASNKLNLSLICNKGVSYGNMDIEPSQIKINGFLIPDSNDVNFAFMEQEPQNLNFMGILPANINYMEAFGFSSFENLTTKLNFIKPNLNSNYWKKINDSALYNVEKEFYNNATNHLVNFETETHNQNYTGLKVNDLSKAKEHLKYMSDSIFTYDSVCFYKLIPNGINKPFKLFDNFNCTATNFAVLYNSYVLFSENYTNLNNLISTIKNQSLLKNNESFVKYKHQNITENFNYLVYNSPSYLNNRVNRFFNFKKTNEKNAFNTFKHFSFALSNNNNNLKFRIQLLNENTSSTNEENTLWTLNLDNACNMQPALFKNHITNENEIALQDEENNCYLINAKGTILWKKVINEKIKSKIYTVDIFKNNKYQLLFSSENYLHLIDRNGNYVQGYPIKLPAPATSELSLLDYDNDKDYRIFIACKNKTIYNYTIYGIKQENFKPYKTDNEINLPIKYTKVGLSDYLVAVDITGKIYAFSRKGEGRIGFKNKTIENCSDFFIDASNNINSSFLFFVDSKQSQLQKISFSDIKTTTNFDLKIDSGTALFCNPNGIQSKSMVITKKNEISAFNLNGNMLFVKTINDNLVETTCYNDDFTNLLISLNSSRLKLVVFNRDNQTLKTINSSTLPLIINLFNDNLKYLITANGKQLNCIAL